MKCFGAGSRKPRLTAVGIRCADHVTPSIRKKLALTLPRSGGHSVGIVCLRTKATEFSFSVLESTMSFLNDSIQTVVRDVMRYIENPYFIYKSHYVIGSRLHFLLSVNGMEWNGVK
jgi:hypothetical protein